MKHSTAGYVDPLLGSREGAGKNRTEDLLAGLWEEWRSGDRPIERHRARRGGRDAATFMRGRAADFKGAFGARRKGQDARTSDAPWPKARSDSSGRGFQPKVLS